MTEILTTQTPFLCIVVDIEKKWHDKIWMNKQLIRQRKYISWSVQQVIKGTDNLIQAWIN